MENKRFTHYSPEQFMKDSGLTTEEVDQAEAEMLEYIRLYELREARKESKLTQKELAQNMGVSQKRVSVLESGDIERVEINTLKRYLEAIGGKLSVIASLPNGHNVELL
ncbi:helix-turn-helix domain-containing protein [Alloscardovia macacae]|nr:helix-turn-helix domain-containing protein [Alloscardovia macacae]